MKEKFSTSQGMVLDPFSIHATGLLRANFAPKISQIAENERLFEHLHGERQFKAAFANACHFAETMTVVGPVAQPIWAMKSSNVIMPSLRWELEKKGANNDLFNHWDQVIAGASWARVPRNRYDTSQGIAFGDSWGLHVMPDFLMRRDNFLGDADFIDDSANELFKFMFEEGHGEVLERQKVEDVNRHPFPKFIRGAPVLSFMAVIFTFKKPTGHLPAYELTNLASWPPMVFLIPTLVPAGASLDIPQWYSSVTDRVNHQPAIASYKLAFHNHSSIIPFGQPFKLTSVNTEGKKPDALRSLSDVFKALWSQATQYSAWSMDFMRDEETGEIDPIGDFNLDPMGAGRRIRGHNRFTSKYNIPDMEFLWEPNCGSTVVSPRGPLAAYNHGGVNHHTYRNQLRSYRNRGYQSNLQMIFTLPSYFTQETAENLYPTALGLFHYAMISGAGLNTFLDGSVVEGVQPYNHDGSVNLEKGQNTESFVDRVHRLKGIEPDKINRGALPVHRVPAAVEFNPEGTPRVFGISATKYTIRWSKFRELDDDEFKEEILDKVKVQDGFKYLDQICSGSTKGLTQAFGSVKASNINNPKSKGAGLLDETLAVDMFDESEGAMI